MSDSDLYDNYKHLIPQGFEELLVELSLDVLQNQPKDYIAHSIEFLKAKAAQAKPDENLGIDEETSLGPMCARLAVAAESINLESSELDFEKPVYEKSPERREALREAIKNTILFLGLDETELNDVIDAMFERQVEPQENVITKGEDGDNFYVIESGIYDILTEDANGKIKPVARYQGAGSFGELALMYSTPRAATIQAVTEGKLWAMSRDTFRHIVLVKAYRRRKLYEGLLQRIELLHPLSAYERCSLADALETISLPEGATVFREGEPGDYMYLVEEGELIVFINGVEISRLSKNSYFGEMALVVKGPRAATVVTATEVRLARLSADMFERLLGPCMNIMEQNFDRYHAEALAAIKPKEVNVSADEEAKSESSSVLSGSDMPVVNNLPRKSVAAEKINLEEAENDFEPVCFPKTEEERERLMKVLEKIMIFSSLEEKDRQSLVDAMFERQVKPDENVIIEQDDGDNFYIIEIGQYDVLLDQVDGTQKKVGEFNGEGYFGELALMYNTPRSATVRATTDGKLWAINRSTFRYIVVVKAFKKRKLYDSLLDSVPLLKNLKPHERCNLADALVSIKVPKGDVIFNEGDEGNVMYLVEEGLVRVTMNGVEVNQLTRGDYFGELALLYKAPRQATAVAVEPTALAALNTDCFERILGHYADLFVKKASTYRKVEPEVSK